MSSIEPDRNSSEIDGSQKVSGGLVITGGKSAERFELTKQVLDPMACLLEALVVSTLEFAIRLGRNYGGFSGPRPRWENSLVGMVALSARTQLSSRQTGTPPSEQTNYVSGLTYSCSQGAPLS